MRHAILAACLTLLPLGALAECVTADSLVKGVSFKRADGRAGRAVARDGGIYVDYAAGKGLWTDERQTLLGIYETNTTSFFSDEELIGSGDTRQTWKFRGKPPVPKAGESWKTRISADAVTDNSSEQGYQEWSGKFDAVYTFLPEMEAKLSGCTYRDPGRGDLSGRRRRLYPALAVFCRSGLWAGNQARRHGQRSDGAETRLNRAPA